MKITKPLRISPSSIGLFFRCSVQYKWATLEEIIPDEGSDNLFAVLGSTMHKLLELHEKYHLSYDELRKSVKILFLTYMSDTSLKDEDYERFLSRGYDLLKAALKLKERWKDNKVLDVERYFRIDYKNSFIENTYLSGRLDLVLKNSKNIYSALDWKSSKSVSKEIDNDLQMSFYIYYIHVKYGIPYENIFGVLAYPHSNRLLFTQRTKNDIQKMHDKISLMLERISKNDFHKEPKLNNNLNDCTFCPYILSCEKR